MDVLRMFYKDADLVVTPTRTPKPISQVAENMTVVTAAEIEAINAHTLADVLYQVTGVQIDVRGGPGSITSALIQGSEPRHVQVMVDGVSLNNLSDNTVDISAIPVQQIERIEIVKGPASSAWGSSLGGIINIITKSPDPNRRFGGSASAAIGERTTGDFRGELSGTVGSLGYYFHGGGLTSDGLTSHTATDMGHLYTKLRWQGTAQSRIQLTFGYDRGSRDDGQFPPAGLVFGDRFENLFSTISLKHAFGDSLHLDLSGHISRKRLDLTQNLAASGTTVNETTTDDLTPGGSVKLTWQEGRHNVIAGFDYDNGRLNSNMVSSGTQHQERWALFANDTITVGPFAVTPGLRYDWTSTNGDFMSPSLGITFAPAKETVLRAYVARGFSTPPLSFTFGTPAGGSGVSFLANPELRMERVWSYSLGVESVLFGHLKVKATGFLHDISDVITTEQLSATTFTAANGGKQRRQGVETEARTLPILHTSLLAGFAFIDIRDRESGAVIRNFPRYTVDLGTDYDDGENRGALRGHYVWWNAEAAAGARYTALIWDLHLARKVLQKRDTAVEAFITAHNLFNGSQYSFGPFPNPRRWFEGGVRCTF